MFTFAGFTAAVTSAIALPVRVNYPFPLFQAYTNTQEFEDLALKLRNNDFSTIDERGQLFRQALNLSMEMGERVWVVDQISFSPAVADLAVTYDLAGGVAGSQLWPYTIDLKSQTGGTVRWSHPGLMVDPWNPIAGPNWIYDQTPARATQDYGIIADPYTGLVWPERIERAEVFALKGLPIARTLDWVSLQYVDSIEVPADAWADWDAVNQKFITAAEKYTPKFIVPRHKRLTFNPVRPKFVYSMICCILINYSTVGETLV